jgi:hypothetical protein
LTKDVLFSDGFVRIRREFPQSAVTHIFNLKRETDEEVTF